MTRVGSLAVMSAPRGFRAGDSPEKGELSWRRRGLRRREEATFGSAGRAEEHGACDVIGLQQLAECSFEADLPLLEEHGPVANLVGDVQALLHEDDGGPLAAFSDGASSAMFVSNTAPFRPRHPNRNEQGLAWVSGPD